MGDICHIHKVVDLQILVSEAFMNSTRFDLCLPLPFPLHRYIYSSSSLYISHFASPFIFFILHIFRSLPLPSL